jgi:hypothetical protein
VAASVQHDGLAADGIALTMTILPRAKALFIAAIWAMKAPGIEQGIAYRA